jgi:hypothetical protein
MNAMILSHALSGYGNRIERRSRALSFLRVSDDDLFDFIYFWGCGMNWVVQK